MRRAQHAAMCSQVNWLGGLSAYLPTAADMGKHCNQGSNQGSNQETEGTLH